MSVELYELQREHAAVEANQEIVRIIDTPLSAMLMDGTNSFNEDMDSLAFKNGHVTVEMEKIDYDYDGQQHGPNDVSAMLADGSFSFDEHDNSVTFCSSSSSSSGSGSGGDTMVELRIVGVTWKTKAPERPSGPIEIFDGLRTHACLWNFA